MKDSHTACLAIERAATQDEVLASVREYLSSLTPDEVALLPAGLAALGTTRAEEVVHSALQLVHHEMRVALDAPEAKLIKEAVVVFSTAATRLATLAALNLMGPSDAEAAPLLSRV
jgi:hypothetical protein